MTLFIAIKISETSSSDKYFKNKLITLEGNFCPVFSEFDKIINGISKFNTLL